MNQFVSQMYHLSVVGESFIGGRPENQDDYGAIETPLGFLAVICDGMGGGPGGKTASYIVKNEVFRVVSSSSPQASRQEVLMRAVSVANETLEKKMREVPSLIGMGSTLVALLINSKSAIVAHLGDSRCYKIRNQKVRFRTNDHSLVGELVQKKTLTEEQARVSQQSNVITRGLGSTSNHVPDIHELKYRAGDRFILCTDGVWGVMPHKQLIQRLTAETDAVTLVKNLATEIDLIGINNGGHHDNHTMLVVDMMENAEGTFGGLKSSCLSLTPGQIALGALLIASVLLNAFLLVKNSSMPSAEEYENTLKELQRLQVIEKRYDFLKSADNNSFKQMFIQLTDKNDSLQNCIDGFEQNIAQLQREIEILKTERAKVKPAVKPASKPSVGKKTTKKNSFRSSYESISDVPSKSPKALRDEIASLLEGVGKIEGSDMGETVKKKQNQVNIAIKILSELDAATKGKNQSTIEAIKRELSSTKTDVLKVMEKSKGKFVSTRAALSKLDLLKRKLEKIKI